MSSGARPTKAQCLEFDRIAKQLRESHYNLSHCILTREETERGGKKNKKAEVSV